MTKELKKHDFKPDPNHEADPEVMDDVMAVVSGRKSMRDLEREADAVVNAGIEVHTIEEANEAAERLGPHESLITNVPSDYVDQCHLAAMQALIDIGFGKSQVSVERLTVTGEDMNGHRIVRDIPGLLTRYEGRIQTYKMTTDCIRPYLSQMPPVQVGESLAKTLVDNLAAVGIRG